MSKERLTPADDLRLILSKIQDCIEMQNGALESQLKSIWNDLSDAITARDFARQEVEAAIAETKKQRDELLTALKALLDYPAEDLVAWAEGTEAIECTFTPYHIKQCLTAITNAQEK
jgi:hypothetical protein